MLAAALGALALSVAQPAAASTPCWKQVINDWVDNGRIEGSYAQHCYREAIPHVPADLATYSSIIDDINAASRRALRTPQVHGSSGGSASTPAERKRAAARKASQPDQGLFKVAFNKLGPRNADSVPLPLLILGGLALLLIAAGAAGLLSRRLRSRRLAQ